MLTRAKCPGTLDFLQKTAAGWGATVPTRDPRRPKLGAPLPADGSAPTATVVVPASDGPEEEWGCRVVTTGLALDLDAAIVVDAMTRAHLIHTRESILEGERPDGGGPQKPLHARALADPDRQSHHRGYRTGELADHLRRTPIAGDASAASSTVLPPTSRTVYVATERDRGVNLLTGDGAAGEAAIAGARAAIAAIATGREVIHDDGEVEAKDADR